MTERVLTDMEIGGLIREHRPTLSPLYGDLDFARAVEAAVLAKVPSCACRGMGIGTVTEREARKRERAAASNGRDRSFLTMDDFARWTDDFYPLPTKRVPRTVVLSDGKTVTCTEDGKLRQVFRVDESGTAPRYWSNCGDPLIYRFAKTPADARLLADLVERPYEEVPDDG